MASKADIATIEELIQYREDWIRSTAQNGHDFDEILVGLYSDPSHFIYEILQNAEDAGATQVSFKLSDDRLDITYNGRPFDLPDVESITAIGSSTKKDDKNQIGKFGVGFKSVFAVTLTPIIDSGPFHFQIDKFVLPKPIGIPTFDKFVRISLPFNHPNPERSAEPVYRRIADKFSTLGSSCILFLSNIKLIEWETTEGAGSYSKEPVGLSNPTGLPIVTIRRVEGEKSAAESYLTYRRRIDPDNEKLNVSAAFRVEVAEDNTLKFIPASKSPIHVYFPTSEETHLSFYVHGPFNTTASREGVYLNDSTNKWIIGEMRELIREALLALKNCGALTLDLLGMFPLDHTINSNSLYRDLFEVTKDVLSSSEGYLPSTEGSYLAPSEIALAKRAALTQLFTPEILSDLFDRKAWVVPATTGSTSRSIRDYLVEQLAVVEISMQDVVEKIDTGFIAARNNDWLISFYNSLHLEYGSLWKAPAYAGATPGILRTTPFIMLSDDTVSAPFNEDGDPVVYLPSERVSAYNTIKTAIIENAEVRSFFEKMGLSTPDLYAELREYILPRYRLDDIPVSIEAHRSDVDIILGALKGEDADEVKGLVSQLRRTPIIPVARSEGGEWGYLIPNKTYVPTPELQAYFKSNQDINFIDLNVYSGINNPILHEYFKTLGCRFVPQKIAVKNDPPRDLIDREKSNHRVTYSWGEEVQDFQWHMLRPLLDVIDLNISQAIWRLLIKAISTLSSYQKRRYFQAKYSYKYHIKYAKGDSSDSIYYDSEFLKVLKSREWLFTKDGERTRPEEITIIELHPDYGTDGENASLLVEILGFKLTSLKALEEETGKHVVLMDAEELVLWHELKGGSAKNSEPTESEERPETDDWKPEITTDDLDIRVSEVVPQPFSLGEDAIRADNKKAEGSVISSFVDDETEGYVKKSMSQVDKDQIGQWGEQYVFKHLENLYWEADSQRTNTGFLTPNRDGQIEVKWLNSNGSIGKGYDFEVLNNGKVVEYIEVKSTIEKQSAIIELSRTQWELAKSLHQAKRGKFYAIYIVLGAGSGEATMVHLVDPINRWFRGDMVTQAVQFKVSI
jgi:hypothetical protein